MDLRKSVERLSDTSRDHERVEVTDRKALSSWSRFLGVSEEELRKAVEQAGPRIGDIRQHLVGGFHTAGPTS
jgi:hypothetical protein